MGTSGFDWIYSHDEKFRYQLLSRMKLDCDYYLGHGGRSTNCLWAIDEAAQIETMKALWNSFSDDKKPEWLSCEQIEQYEADMGIEEDHYQ